MKKFIHILSKSLVIFQLSVGQASLYAGTTVGTSATAPKIQTRTEDIIKDIIQSSSPSDIPFIEYVDSFKPESTQPIKRIDISRYNGKMIYLGYGIYDQQNKFCKYVELPTKPSPAPNLVFKDIKTFNTRTYAIARDTGTTPRKMTYQQCKNLAFKYGGIVATPENLAENAFISSYRTDNWLGIERPSCTDQYYNLKGEYQDFTNWSTSAAQSTCSSSKLNVMQYPNGRWEKVSGGELHACIIEVDSPDINRPVKICAPWWRIERTYNEKPRTDVYGFNLETVNQADIPKLFNICTKYDENGTAKIEDNSTQRFTCTTYYDATVAPECLRSPYQPQCYVSECKGYVENVCTHIKEVKPFKDYTKIQILDKNGNKATIKGKVHIRTQVYECPAVTPGSGECLEKSTVIAYPKECPGSQCDARKKCYAEGKDSDDFIACDQKYKCEKIWPSTDFTPVPSDLDANGEVKIMHGKCSDGTVLDFDVNIQNKLNKSCIEWNVYTKTKKIKKTCVVDRSYEDYTVDMSITEEDEYQNDPNCVRMNNINDARPDGNAIFDINFNGYAHNSIWKAYIDGTQEKLTDTGNSNYLQEAASVHLEDTTYSDSGSVRQEPPTPRPGGLSSCPLNDSGSESQVNNWAEKKLGPLMNSGVGAYQELSGGTVYAYPKAMTMDACDDFAGAVGGSVQGYSPCKVSRTATSQDRIFSRIERVGGTIDEPKIKFTSARRDYTDAQCKDFGDCLDADGNLDSNNRCVATTSDGNDADGVVPPASNNVVSCTPPTSTDSKVAKYNGVSEIFAITDYLGGRFGYTSNYMNHPLTDNKVLVNGKEVFPIAPTAKITDKLDYISKIKQVSITTKRPNFLAGAIGGAASGAAYVWLAETVSIPVLGAIIVVAFVVFALLFAKKMKLNEESIYYLVYKDVPKNEYINNVYGYDTRWKTDSDVNWRMKYLIAGEDPGPGDAGNCWGHGGRSYWKNFTGTLKKGDFPQMLTNMFKKKQQDFACMGFTKEQTPSTTMETRITVGYPKCKWYQFNCNKENHSCSAQHVKLPKPMDTYYIGGTQSLSLVVPFLGDYEVEAYDQYDELLGSTTIYADDFVGGTDNVYPNAQINFGLVMKLAAGIDEGTLNNACREVTMVEWGGGVSGIYYENHRADDVTKASCQKSNDSYVKDHSMTKIRIRPTNQTKWYVFQLQRPMPFANRIRLVSLGEKEIREYRCYNDFDSCSADKFEEAK